MNLHDEMKVRRKLKGMTQGELAAEAGVSRPTVARFERGDDISLENLAKLAAVMGAELALTNTTGLNPPRS